MWRCEKLRLLRHGKCHSESKNAFVLHGAKVAKQEVAITHHEILVSAGHLERESISHCGMCRTLYGSAIYFNLFNLFVVYINTLF